MCPTLRRWTIPALFLLPGSFLFGCAAQSEQEACGSPVATLANRTDRPAAVVPQRVVIDNFTFDPHRLTVAAGTKVTWINRDDVPHTVTSPARPRLLDSSTLDTDQSFSHVFTAPGTYDYYCTVHPKMTGQVIVK